MHKTESVSCRGVPLPPTVRLGVLWHWRRADDGAADFVCYRNETAPCASAAAKSTGAGAAGGARRAGRPCPQCYPGFQCVIIGTTRPAFLHRRRPDEPPVITTSSRIPSILRFFICAVVLINIVSPLCVTRGFNIQFVFKNHPNVLTSVYRCTTYCPLSPPKCSILKSRSIRFYSMPDIPTYISI